MLLLDLLMRDGGMYGMLLSTPRFLVVDSRNMPHLTLVEAGAHTVPGARLYNAIPGQAERPVDALGGLHVQFSALGRYLGAKPPEPH
jgi:hypothetical protein